MPAISVFLLLVCSFQIYSGKMKWVALNKTVNKRLRNVNFQTVVSLLYAHYPIFFLLSFKKHCHALPSALIQEKV